MKIKSFAKINLGLNILNKRKDGYHLLQTIFYPINLYDNIIFKPSNKIQVTCIPDIGIQEEENIAFKTAKLLQKYYDCKLKGINIEIKKNIPDGAGLGGGSSNAATTLLSLNKLWNLNLSFEQLLEISKKLGADVPFFLIGKPAIASGIGDILEPIELNLPYKIIIISSNIKISTKMAYKLLNRGYEKIPTKNYYEILEIIRQEPHNMKYVLSNDFESIIFKMHPELKNIKALLYDYGAIFAQMTGSGSAIYGFFEDIDNLQSIQTEIAKNGFKLHIT